MRLVVRADLASLQKEIEHLDEVAAGAFKTKLADELEKLGEKLHVSLIEPLMLQTGLHGSTIPRALHDQFNAEGLIYTIVTRGGNISMKYFHPKEGNGGVTAYPRDVKTFTAGGFMTSGRAPSRFMTNKLGGQVYEPNSGSKVYNDKKVNGRGQSRRGSWYRPIKQVKSGVFIPEEMIRGTARTAFENLVRSELSPMASRCLTMIAK